MTTEANDKKKVFGLPYGAGIALLCVLGAVCLYEFYSNVLAGPGGAPDAGRSTVTSASAPPPTIPMPGAESVSPSRTAATRGRSEEFHPVLHSKRPEDRIDPIKVDPTLRLDLLAKVQAVEPAGGSRNLFQMGAPPPKPVELPKGPETIVKVGPQPPSPPPPPPPAPPPTPIPLKFYGYSTVRSSGKKTAYFMDGEEILIASEGETLKRRYRVVRIGLNSVLMEDTESKRQQSIPLTEEAQS
ncbi:MAG: hypothetical protein LAQ69_22620 [Acidobacteriia bacterium]|nr:hypothetical protein [Terriglobia bacterium]